jgi:ferredoxin-type protein NapH
MSWIRSHPYLLGRRTTQVGVLALFWLGAHLHLGLLTGNLSSASVLRTVPLADPYAALQILATGHALSGTLLVGATAVLLFWFLVGGRAFCAWICPVNAVTDLAGWLKAKLRTRDHLRVDRSVRYWIAGLAIAVSAVTGLAAFEMVSPIGMIQRGLIFAPGLGLLAIGGIFLLDLLVVRNGWCGSLCPLGAFYSLVGRWSLLRVGFDRDRCDLCGDCLPICPEPQVIRFHEMTRKGFIDSGNCLNCARCLEVCSRGAYHFALRLDPRLQRTGRGGRSTCDSELPSLSGHSPSSLSGSRGTPPHRRRWMTGSTSTTGTSIWAR